jgi:hypothetical protein
MKRRKFIQASLLAGALPATAGTERLYGTPASLTPGGGKVGDKFLLPLSRSGLPTSTWNEFAAVSQIIDNVVGSKTESDIFFKSPKNYLRTHGLDASDKTLVDKSVLMLTCLTDPVVQESVAKSDWDAVLEHYRAAGLLENRDPALLQKQVLAAVEESSAEIAEIMKSQKMVLREEQEQFLLEFLEQSGHVPTEDDLATVAQIVSSGMASPTACSVVTVCGAAVTVAVAVVVAVVTLTLVSTTAASYVDVYASELVSNPSYGMSTEDETPFTGSIAKLDPVLVRNTTRAIRMGALLGAPGLQAHVVKSLINEEVRVFMTALQKANLFTANDEQLELAIRAVSAYSYRSIDL